jgi:hypothetical protein
MSGPLFDGRADKDVREFCTEALDQVAGQASANVHHNAETSFQHPTPYYETQIRVRKASEVTRVVDDRGIIYGHWLQGDGSRNYPVTSFHGYMIFPRAAALLETQVARLIERARVRMVERLNGR